VALASVVGAACHLKRACPLARRETDNIHNDSSRGALHSGIACHDQPLISDLMTTSAGHALLTRV